MKINRRDFIKGVAAATTLAQVPGAFASVNMSGPSKSYPVFFFTKPIDSFGPEFVAESLSRAGVEGFDLSVRPKGIVEPERVKDELPGVIEIGKKFNLRSEMMVSAITSPSDANARTVLETASGLGIKHYRIGYCLWIAI